MRVLYRSQGWAHFAPMVIGSLIDRPEVTRTGELSERLVGDYSETDGRFFCVVVVVVV